jgi:4-carboxymuconolactone decarboxylase
MPEDSALFDKGLPIRRAVLGSEYVDRSLAAADEFTMAMQRVATAWGWGWGWGWGWAWGDPTLDRRRGR